MSKELEAFKKISEIHGNTSSLEGTYEYFLTIKRALVRLETIENANPSKALKELELVENWIRDRELKISNVIKPSLNTIKQALLKAEKEHNSVNLLMQELDCKDFAELRKYARCGYQTFRNAKGANYDNIIIDEAQEPKQYLKWEDLEFGKEEQTMKVLLNGERYLVKYVNEWFCGWCNKVQITNGTYILCTLGNGMKQFFNDLRLERVEE